VEAGRDLLVEAIIGIDLIGEVIRDFTVRFEIGGFRLPQGLLGAFRTG